MQSAPNAPAPTAAADANAPADAADPARAPAFGGAPIAPIAPSHATGPAAGAYVVKPPAARARQIALVLSAIAVGFSLGFGVAIRRAFALRDDPEQALRPFLVAMVLLLVALLFRMCAAVCELLWLERTWSNLPEHLRKVGPVEKVNAGLVIGLSVVPGVAWVWKLGIVIGIADGFEKVRASVPFAAPVPRKLGVAAVITGWVPGLNVYVAPFLWEMFATRMERVIREILAARPAG
jgi:hypothetical protein